MASTTSELFNKSFPEFIHACGQCQWIPQIMVDSSEWTMINDVPCVVPIRSYNLHLNKVDIISIMNLSKSDLHKNINSCCYPPFACFRFTGFRGPSDKENIINYIKGAAEKYGSPLIVSRGSFLKRST
jgi:hypothetical protein